MRRLNKEEDVWTISDRPQNNNGLHAAAFPDKLVKRCLSVGCPPDGEVLDPLVGTGTVMRVAVRLGRPAVGVDLNRDFCEYTSPRRMRKVRSRTKAVASSLPSE